MSANIVKEIFTRILKIEENLAFVNKEQDPSIDNILKKIEVFEKFIKDSLEVRRVTEDIVIRKMEAILDKKLSVSTFTDTTHIEDIVKTHLLTCEDRIEEIVRRKMEAQQPPTPPLPLPDTPSIKMDEPDESVKQIPKPMKDKDKSNKKKTTLNLE